MIAASPENLMGLGPKGQPLDVPVPSADLPKKLRGRLQMIAWACAWLAAKAGLPSARSCPCRDSCRVWPFRAGDWKEAETALDPESELLAHMDSLTGGAPPNSRLRCYANSPFGPCKLPNYGTCESAKAELSLEPRKLELSHFTVTCAVCGKPFPAKRKGATVCSQKCRQKAYRRRQREAADEA